MMDNRIYLKFLLKDTDIIFGIGLNESNGLETFSRNEVVLDARFSRKTCSDDCNEHQRRCMIV